MSFQFPQPTNEDNFELFCLRFLRKVWNCPALNLFGKRGERQHGIDIIDESASVPFRAAQCKFHERQKTIPPAEIQAEVQSALGYEHPLDEYHLLTTARKSAQSQNAVIRINREHSASGQFKLTLWTWTEIEHELSQMDEASSDFVLHGDTGRSAPALMMAVKGMLGQHFSYDRYSSTSVIDAELLGVKAALDSHLLEVAEDRIKQIVTRGADHLENRHRYELKAYRSNIYMRRGEWNLAGRELLAGKTLLPTTERAKINEALGLELTGERTAAHCLAQQLRIEYPHSVHLARVWIFSSPETVALESAEAVGLPFANDDDEINLALAHKSLLLHQLDKAISYARKATELDAEAPQGWFLLAQALHASGHEAIKALRDTTLNEALINYDRAAKLAHAQKWVELESIIRMSRGSALWLLGSPKAESDLLAALDLSSSRDRQVDYAGFLVQNERHEDAI